MRDIRDWLITTFIKPVRMTKYDVQHKLGNAVQIC